jgi:hypothetical protein
LLLGTDAIPRLRNFENKTPIGEIGVKRMAEDENGSAIFNGC